MARLALAAATIFAAAGQYMEFDDSAVTDHSDPVSVKAADTDHIRWQGPVVVGPIGEMHGSVSFAWPGVKVMFTIFGASRVSMNAIKTYAADGQRFRVFVDSEPTSTVVLSGNEYRNITLAEGLEPLATHIITLWYISDPIPATGSNILSRDSIAIKAFSLDAGEFGPAPPERIRRMQILGDSIISGNQISPALGCEPDQALTYVSRLCELYRVNCSITALTGKGVYTNCCDDDVTMVELYNRAIPGIPGSKNMNADFHPDAVFLNLGTNDQARWEMSGGDADPLADSLIGGFTDSYADLLLKLTVLNGRPNLPVFAAFGHGKYGSWIRHAIQVAKARGASNVFPLNFSFIRSDGCVEHPGLVGHQQMYEKAAPIIAEAMGWMEGDGSLVFADIQGAQSAQLWSRGEGASRKTRNSAYIASMLCFAIVATLVAVSIKYWRFRKANMQSNHEQESSRNIVYELE